MMPCVKEEADSRIVIHVIHAIESGYLSISIRTVDSDVLVILVGHFSTFLSINPTIKLWVAFGTVKDFRIFYINQFFSDLGEEFSKALPVIHTFSGCDTASSLTRKGKRSVWKTV